MRLFLPSTKLLKEVGISVYLPSTKYSHLRR